MKFNMLLICLLLLILTACSPYGIIQGQNGSYTYANQYGGNPDYNYRGYSAQPYTYLNQYLYDGSRNPYFSYGYQGNQNQNIFYNAGQYRQSYNPQYIHGGYRLLPW